MRILELIPVLIDGGAERFIVDISKEFVEEGHTVHIASLFPEDPEGMKFFPDWDERVTRSFLDKQLGFDWKVILRLRSLIRSFKPDVIHTHLRVANYLAIAQLFSFRRVPVVHTVHNHAPEEVDSDKEKKFRSFLYRSKRLYPVTISGVSDASFDDFYDGLKAKRIDNGRSFPEKTEKYADVSEFFRELRNRLGEDCRFWLNIGRLTPQKNQVMLVRAFQRLLDEGHNAALLILGTERPPFSDPILKEMQPFLGDRIQWLGGKINATDYLHLSDYFVLSSEYEGMPISLIEAMATKALPVSTPVGGIPEMIEPHGVLSQEKDEDSFVKALIKASEIDSLEKEEAQEQLYNRYLDRYSMKSCANQYLQYFKILQ